MYVFLKKWRRRLHCAATAPSSSFARATATPAARLNRIVGDVALGRAQAVDVNRHAAALHPFRHNQFGDIAAAPTEGISSRQ